jgi:hypothetical protein
VLRSVDTTIVVVITGADGFRQGGPQVSTRGDCSGAVDVLCLAIWAGGLGLGCGA